MAEVADDLFSGDRMSFEIDRVFADKYQRVAIRWSGVLRKVTPYFSDLVFGPDPGTRAVFEVHELDTKSYFGRTIQAVVELPEGAAELLESRVGDTITFRGILASCDAFMRNLFVGNGTLETS